MNLKIKNFSKINGTVKAPSSKSYSHRAVILASLAEGKSKLFDVLYSEDVLSSIRACEALGAKIDRKKEIILKETELDDLWIFTDEEKSEQEVSEEVPVEIAFQYNDAHPVQSFLFH